MSWILLTLLSTFLWSCSIVLDKFTLSKNTKGVYDFSFFGALGSFLIALIVFGIFGLEHIALVSLIPIISGVTLQISYLLYSHGLDLEDASYVTPLYMTYTVFVLIIGIFAGDGLTPIQLLAFSVTFIGVMILSTKNFSAKIFTYRKAMLFIIPAAISLATYLVLIDYSLNYLSIPDIFIYEAIGFSISALLFLLVPGPRKEIFEGLKMANFKKCVLFLINDSLDLFAGIAQKFALVLAPSVSLVAVISGVQPFFVLIICLALTIFLPNIMKENTTTREVLQKLVGIILVVIGITILNLYAL